MYHRRWKLCGSTYERAYWGKVPTAKPHDPQFVPQKPPEETEALNDNACLQYQHSGLMQEDYECMGNRYLPSIKTQKTGDGEMAQQLRETGVPKLTPMEGGSQMPYLQFQET